MLGKNTLCLIVGDITFRVKTLIKSNKYDMVRMEWLLRFLNDDDESIEEPDWTPFDMIYALEKTKENINIFYDEYGDNFRIPATLESLKKCMNHMVSFINKLIFKIYFILKFFFSNFKYKNSHLIVICIKVCFNIYRIFKSSKFFSHFFFVF